MLPDDIKQSIQLLYSDFLSARGLKPRLGQKQMIGEIARILSRIGDAAAPPIGLIEAGTGTGKTLAYLVAALPVGLAREMPILVSTATVSLQRQLIDKDLPELAASGRLDFQWALAKGRRRYLCPIRLESAIESVDGETGLYPDELVLVLDADDRDAVTGLGRAWTSGQWDGDMDAFPEPLTESVKSAVTTDHHRCQGRQCGSFSVCPYFRAREHWDGADILVINHDLLMSDLKLGGGVLLPPLERCILILDEAHQLARVSGEQFTDQMRIAQALGAIKSLDRVITTLTKVLPTDHRLQRDLSELPDALLQLGHVLVEWGGTLRDALLAEPDSAFSYQQGGTWYRLMLDRSLPAPGTDRVNLTTLMQRLEKTRDWLKGQSEGRDLLGDTDAERLAGQLALASGRLESIPALIKAFGLTATDTGHARWIRVGYDLRYATPDDPTDIELWASPMQPAEYLADRLWGRVGAAILTSATLAHSGGFARVSETLGLPVHEGLVVAGAFDYARQGRLWCPSDATDPRDEERHAERIAAYLETRTESGLGILVLFTSWRLLGRVEELLGTAVRAVILVQGQLPLEQLLAKHRSQRDANQTSIIFGLQSMAEGLDLPGDLANEVVITRLPFQPPDDPREATCADYLKLQGRDAFAELSLPHATIRLRQAVGRLIRSEDDSGQITVLDRRLVNTTWGRKLLKELPAFSIME